MQQVLFIGGGNVYPTRELFSKELSKRNYNPFEIKKKWKSSLGEKLGDNFQVALIDLPNRDCASFYEWEIVFKKIFQFLKGQPIIIAHSLGTIFIMKYLVENGFITKIKQLHLVSPLMDDKDLPEGENYLGDFKFDTDNLYKIQNYIDKIYIYHSKDDRIVPFEQGERIHKILNNSILFTFENRGHFLQEDFPEIIENIRG